MVVQMMRYNAGMALSVGKMLEGWRAESDILVFGHLRFESVKRHHLQKLCIILPRNLGDGGCSR